MEINNVVFGISGRLDAVGDVDLMQKLSVTRHRYLGRSINEIRYYAVQTAVLTDWTVEKCKPDFWKVIKNGETLVYIELGDAATAKIHKFVKGAE